MWKLGIFFPSFVLNDNKEIKHPVVRVQISKQFAHCTTDVTVQDFLTSCSKQQGHFIFTVNYNFTTTQNNATLKFYINNFLVWT